MNSISVYLISSIGRVFNTLLYFMSLGLHLLVNVSKFGNSQLIACTSWLKDPLCYSWKYFSWRHFKICFLVILPTCIFLLNSHLIWWYSIKHWRWSIYNSPRNNTNMSLIFHIRQLIYEDLALLKNVYCIIYCLLPYYKIPGGSYSTSEMLIVYYYFLFSLLWECNFVEGMSANLLIYCIEINFVNMHNECLLNSH